MQIKLRGKQVGVEKIKKGNKKADTFLHIPDSEEFSGIVRYVGPAAASDITVGQKVYFASQFQTMRLAGSEICVMEDQNILAVQNEETSPTEI